MALIRMSALLRDACIGLIKFALPESRPLFEERRQFLEKLGIKTKPENAITKEEYMRRRAEWIYLFNVSDPVHMRCLEPLVHAIISVLGSSSTHYHSRTSLFSSQNLPWHGT